jgi:hypothetical protein
MSTLGVTLFTSVSFSGFPDELEQDYEDECAVYEVFDCHDGSPLVPCRCMKLLLLVLDDDAGFSRYDESCCGGGREFF